jgi:GGDEF domain-containing protein
MTSAVEFGGLDVERARYEELMDELTGLPMWTLLLDRTTVALARARRAGNEIAVFVLEDPRMGRRARDLVGVAEILGAKLRPDDTLARIGERRLAVVLNDIRVDSDAAAVARRLIYTAGIVCGLGVALGGIDDTPELVISRAMREALRTAIA